MYQVRLPWNCDCVLTDDYIMSSRGMLWEAGIRPLMQGFETKGTITLRQANIPSVSNILRKFSQCSQCPQCSHLILQCHIKVQSNVEAVETAIERLNVPVSNEATDCIFTK